ncbi:MAG: M48 family metalloprotease [Bacteroidota bacterium]
MDKQRIQTIEQQCNQSDDYLKSKNRTFKRFFHQRCSQLLQEIIAENFYSDERVCLYFEQIFSHIITTNPELQHHNLRLFVSREDVPNAYCMGEGTIVFNLQLLEHLSNESQIAFVLAHEIAHQTLNHVDNSVSNRIERYYSKSTQKQLKKANRSTYDSNAKLLEAHKDLLYNNRRHDRAKEIEADATGFHYLMNTKYATLAATNCLARLDSIEKGKIAYPPVPLAECLGTPDYPFKASWLERGNSIFSNSVSPVSVFESDSIRTHPDCEERIQRIQQAYTLSTEGAEFLQSKHTFQSIQQQLFFEQARNQYVLENFGRGLYYFLRLSQKYPDNAYVHAQVGAGLVRIYHAVKAHDFNEVVAVVHPNHEADYQDLLHVLHNIRSSEIKQLAYHYLTTHYSKF